MLHTAIGLIYSHWIDQEIRFALEASGRKKPIVAMKPRGNHKIAKKVKEHADLIVGWNTEAIIEGIRKVAIKNGKDSH